MSTRIDTVPVGAYQVGDILNGYRITGFGRAWTADEEDNAGYYTEEWADRVCYAYGELVAEAEAPRPAYMISDTASDTRARRMSEASKSAWQRLEEEAAAIESTAKYYPEAYRAAQIEKAAALRSEAAALQAANQ